MDEPVPHTKKIKVQHKLNGHKTTFKNVDTTSLDNRTVKEKTVTETDPNPRPTMTGVFSSNLHKGEKYTKTFSKV